MTQLTGSQYYVSQRTRLLRQFDWAAKRMRKSMAKRYDDAFALEVIADARLEFSRIIPELPYIGGKKNLFTPVMIINGWLIALYRTMKARGKSVEEVMQICVDVSDGFFRAFPRFLLRLGGRAAFSGLVKNTLRKQAALSQEKRFAEDFVYTVREGGEDDFALEFKECAVNKMYDQQQVDELKPFCNFFDVTYSRLMGMGLNANETIGQGCQTCKLRFKHDRETIVPQRIKGMYPT